MTYCPCDTFFLSFITLSLYLCSKCSVTYLVVVHFKKPWIAFTYASIVSSTFTPHWTSWWALRKGAHIAYYNIPYSNALPYCGVYHESFPYLTVHTLLQSTEQFKSKPVSRSQSWGYNLNLWPQCHDNNTFRFENILS